MVWFSHARNIGKEYKIDHGALRIDTDIIQIKNWKDLKLYSALSVNKLVDIFVLEFSLSASVIQ